tara:strand:- start:593 stop:841 length:249 start_codon:yes stop_codon:yes gene_type:complete
MWKEMVEDIEGDGAWHAMTPRDDGRVYEFPINFKFATMSEAYSWLEQESEDWGIEHSESEDWMLVEIVQTLLPKIEYTHEKV